MNGKTRGKVKNVYIIVIVIEKLKKKRSQPAKKKATRGRQDLRINVFNNKASSKNISIKLAVIRSLFRLYFRGEKVNLFQSGRRTERGVVPLGVVCLMLLLKLLP